MGVDRPFSEPFVRDRISNGEEVSKYWHDHWGRWLTTLRVILPGPKESTSPRWSTQLPELFWRRLGQTGPSHESQNQRGDHALIMTRSNRHYLDA